MQKQLLYFCPVSYGGLAEYSHEQANALANERMDVELLAPVGFPEKDNRNYKLSLLPLSKIQLKGKLGFIQKTINAYHYLYVHILTNAPDFILFGSFSETLAPLWYRKFLNLRKKGVKSGVVVHDPVRVKNIGPVWWWKWSLKCACSIFDVCFCHTNHRLHKNAPAPIVIPHGPYSQPERTESCEQTRNRLALLPNKTILLSFGHLKNYKRVDDIIRALKQLDDCYLIVAGTEARKEDHTSKYYQNLAEELKVADKCRWLIDYLPDEEVANLFHLSDIVMISYDEGFHSASGVLNLATTFRKPVVASAGKSNLLDVMNKYCLGEIVRPRQTDDIVKAVKLIKSQNEMRYDWDVYEQENSWENNAKMVIQNLPDNSF